MEVSILVSKNTKILKEILGFEFNKVPYIYVRDFLYLEQFPRTLVKIQIDSSIESVYKIELKDCSITEQKTIIL